MYIPNMVSFMLGILFKSEKSHEVYKEGESLQNMDYR